MRTFFHFRHAFLLSALSLICVTGSFAHGADEADQQAALVAALEKPEPTSLSQIAHAASLDQLFGALKTSGNEVQAKRVAGQLRGVLADSGSASVDLLTDWSRKALAKQDAGLALDLLDQALLLRPQYADGYAQRAYVHFLQEDYPLAMADIDRALRFEPRHFPALETLALIMENTGRDALALQAYERILAIYPAMRSAQTEVGRLADKLVGERS